MGEVSMLLGEEEGRREEWIVFAPKILFCTRKVPALLQKFAWEIGFAQSVQPPWVVSLCTGNFICWRVVFLHDWSLVVYSKLRCYPYLLKLLILKITLGESRSVSWMSSGYLLQTKIWNYCKMDFTIVHPHLTLASQSQNLIHNWGN